MSIPRDVRLDLLDAFSAKQFLMRIGFVEDGTSGEYHRAGEPTPAEREVGITGLEWIHLPSLLANLKTWRRFVHRWSVRTGVRFGS